MEKFGTAVEKRKKERERSPVKCPDHAQENHWKKNKREKPWKLVYGPIDKKEREIG